MIRVLIIILVLFAVLSFAQGTVNFINTRVDWQFANSLILIQGESPFYSWVHKSELFNTYIRYWQWPTSLPLLYVLGLFFAWNEKILMVFYLFSGIGLLLLFLKRNMGINRRSIIIISLLLISTCYRNNLGNGQWLYLFFPVGLFYLYDIKISRNQKYILLAFLSTKISIFPFLGLLLKRKELLYSAFWVLFLNLLGFLVLCLISDTSPNYNYKFYIKILEEVTKIKYLENLDLIDWNTSKILYFINFSILLTSLVLLVKNCKESVNSITMIFGISLLNVFSQYSSYDYFLWLVPFFNPNNIENSEGKVLLFILVVLCLEFPLRILLNLKEAIEVYYISHACVLIWLISKFNFVIGLNYYVRFVKNLVKKIF